MKVLLPTLIALCALSAACEQASIGEGKVLANAGVDQVVRRGDTVTLDATGSKGGSGAPLRYTWTQSSGAPVTLASPSLARTTFSAPDPGALGFTLLVTDGVSNAMDAVTVTVTPSTGTACEKVTCAGLGKNCGSVSDGCGSTLNCGSCTSPQICGGAGVTNECGGGAGGGGGGGGGGAGGGGGGGAGGGGGGAGGGGGGGSTGGGDPILIGAGDISACGSNNGEPTAKILDGVFANGANANGVVFTMGDNAYEDGTLTQYNTCYGPTWGRHKARTRPSAGNHEWHTAGAAGYFDYFGAAGGDRSKGAYYSYDLGSWHIIVIDVYNTAGTGAGSEQEKWLKADLAAHPNKCTLAYWHAPRFSSGTHGSSSWLQNIWQALYDANADVVVSGHDHHYERFAPQTPSGSADPARGIREFLVGTGGDTVYSIGSPIANSEVRYNGGYGVIKFTLHATSYDWEFLSEAGKTFNDKGTGSCH